MRAAVRGFSSPDVDLHDYRPSDPEDDGFLLQMMVGPADGPGDESFDIIVCSSAWFARLARERGPQIGRHHLVMDRVDIQSVEAFLRRQVEQLDEPSWQELALKVGRLGRWEFEDYQP